MKTRILQDIHNTQVVMLNEFASICESFNLKWWAYSHTLIGTILYQGFLPNTFNITVGMMRKDFNQLIKLKPKNPYVIQTSYDYPGLCTINAQFRNTATTHLDINEQYSPFNYNKGMYIEIIPFDFVGDIDKNILNNYIDAIKSSNNILKDFIKSGKLDSNLSNTLQTIHNNTCAFMNMCQNQSSQDKVITNYNQYVLNHRRYFDKSYIDETIKMKFETTTINVPVMYRHILEIMYGPQWYTHTDDFNQMKSIFMIDPHTPWSVTLKNLNNSLTHAQL